MSCLSTLPFSWLYIMPCSSSLSCSVRTFSLEPASVFSLYLFRYPVLFQYLCLVPVCICCLVPVSCLVRVSIAAPLALVFPTATLLMNFRGSNIRDPPHSSSSTFLYPFTLSYQFLQTALLSDILSILSIDSQSCFTVSFHYFLSLPSLSYFPIVQRFLSIIEPVLLSYKLSFFPAIHFCINYPAWFTFLCHFILSLSVIQPVLLYYILSYLPIFFYYPACLTFHILQLFPNPKTFS